MRTKPIRVEDLVKFADDRKQEIETPEDARAIIMDGVKLHKAKFWGKIKDEYVKEDK